MVKHNLRVQNKRGKYIVKNNFKKYSLTKPESLFLIHVSQTTDKEIEYFMFSIIPITVIVIFTL